jgi:predicted branched-subunit amino acid permease
VFPGWILKASEVDWALVDKDRNPSKTDYMAGAVLANCLVWVWLQSMGYFGDALSGLPPGLLSLATSVICFLSETLASYQVCRRASSDHLVVGLKVAVLALVFSPFIVLPILEEFSLGLVIILLVCFPAGGFCGAYLTIKARLKGRTPVKEEPNTGEEVFKSESP